MAAYAALVLFTYSNMKIHFWTRDPIARFLGVAPTGVYADGMFMLGPPIVRLVLKTKTGPVDLPSFDFDGYPTVRDRFWKQFVFFTRLWPCGMDRIYRHIAMWSDRCHTDDCTVAVYQRGAALRSFKLDPDLCHLDDTGGQRTH